MERISIAFTAAVIAAAVLRAQNSPRPPDADWPMYSHDLAGTKYSSLAQITADNVSTLTQAWTVRVAAPATARGARAASAGQAPPADVSPAPAAQGPGA